MKLKIWFAWACHLSRTSVEPLYEAAVAAGYDCTMAARGRYDDLSERMQGYTHYVFGVGPDVSWRIARESGLVGINIMHGQYIFNTWYGPYPDYAILTGPTYVEDLRRMRGDAIPKVSTPGYVHADVVKQYTPGRVKDIECLVALPKTNEHPSLEVINLINNLRSIPGVVFRVHPRDSKFKKHLTSVGATVDTNVKFYDSLSRAKCLLSGPSNCIIEGCIHGVPVGLFAICPDFVSTNKVDRELRAVHNYFIKMKSTYSTIATIFDGVEHMKHWVKHPVAKPREHAARYWANTDGNIKPVTDDFLRILRLEATK